MFSASTRSALPRPKPLRSLVRVTLMLAVVVGLTACGQKLAYNFLDWYMLWKIERYVELRGTQKDEAKSALQRFHRWHRQTQLPQYADYLEGLQKRLDTHKVDSQFIHAETDEVQLLLDQSLNRLLPDIARIGSTLSDRQVTELLHNMAKRRDKFVDEYVDISPDKQVDKRYNKLKGYLDDWLGGLTRTQRGWLKEWANSLEPYEALTAAQQGRWAEQVAELMEDRADANELFNDLRRITLYRSDEWAPEIQGIVDRNQERTYTMLARVLNNLTDKQQDHLNKKLSEYIKNLRELAREAESPAKAA